MFSSKDTKYLPNDWKGGFVLLVLVFVPSGFLDNIAAAMIGGAVAATVFRGKVHIGYLAAIVAASNAGGAGSVVGDTTTTMIWISGISPTEVVEAYIASAVALVILGVFAARQQHAFHPIQREAEVIVCIDGWSLAVVGFILAAAVSVNVFVNLRWNELADSFPFIGTAVWMAIFIGGLLRVMISSRCMVDFDGRKLSDIRKELKQEIEALTVFDHRVFEVWINEEQPSKPGGWNSVEVCLDAVRDWDILIVLSNGHAGWTKEEGGIGICHAELMEGINTAPGKVRLIDLGNVPADNRSKVGKRNKVFQDYIESQGLFHGGTVHTVDELKERVKGAVIDALISLTQAGVLDASRGRYHSGSALDWSRLDFEVREKRMRDGSRRNR